MRVVWANHPVTATEIIAQLVETDATWHPKTARTLLARLVRKKVLEGQLRGRSYIYKPRLSQSECTRDASESFLERVFGGALMPMLAHFVEAKRLTKNDLEELQGLLDETRSDDKPGRV